MATAPPAPLRADIQALRGLAVSLVIIYHAKIGLFPAGYLGVDIFFVVSGFLITGIIRREIEDRRFSFRRFYFRRARRLLPAAYTMLAVTTLLAGFLLSSSQFRDFASQLYGSVFFVSNIVLWQQTGYFSEDALLKPLLHMWSLSIEEQYYLLVPLILTVVPRKLWLPLILLAIAGSFGAAAFLAYSRPSVAFFMLPVRAWELGLGSAGALLVGREGLSKAAGKLLLPSLLLLLLIPSFPLGLPHPGPNALLVCFATLFVILADSERLNRSAIAAALGRIGDWSYSLYLVHFPLFALTRVAFLRADLPLELALALILLSFLLGYALYRYVELPGRYAEWSPRRLVPVLIGASALLLAMPAVALQTWKRPAAPEMQLALQQAPPACEPVERWVESFTPACSDTERPRIMIWGDSIAGTLRPAVAASTDQPVILASKGMCAPILDLAVVQETHDVSFARTCLAYNESVLRYLAAQADLDVVVLSGSLVRLFEDGVRLIRREGTAELAGPPDRETILRYFARTVERLRAAGKRVIFVTGPPHARYDLGRCWERAAEGVVMLGSYRDCVLKRAELVSEQEEVFSFLELAAERAKLPVVRLDRALCRGATCYTLLHGKPLYRDGYHFTYEGSAQVGRRLGLGSSVLGGAR